MKIFKYDTENCKTARASVLLVTHSGVGRALLDAVAKTFGTLPLRACTFCVDHGTDPDVLLPTLQTLSNELDHGCGVLILTDVLGATPSNIAHKLQENDQVEIIAGLNLPMLIRVMNYPDLPLTELAQVALSGGQRGICSYGVEITTA